MPLKNTDMLYAEEERGRKELVGVLVNKRVGLFACWMKGSGL